MAVNAEHARSAFERKFPIRNFFLERKSDDDDDELASKSHTLLVLVAVPIGVYATHFLSASERANERTSERANEGRKEGCFCPTYWVELLGLRDYAYASLLCFQARRLLLLLQHQLLLLLLLRRPPSRRLRLLLL